MGNASNAAVVGAHSHKTEPVYRLRELTLEMRKLENVTTVSQSLSGESTHVRPMKIVWKFIDFLKNL